MDVSGRLHALVPLPLKKVPHYPLNRQLGGPQSKCGSFREENIFCPYTESLFLGCLASSEQNPTTTQYFQTQH